jgi:translation initiation factor 1
MTKKSSLPGETVYSTEHGRMCPACGNALTQCACHHSKKIDPGDGIVRISRQTKGRKGKGVTLITGISSEDNDVRALAKKLKQLCGSGGTVKDGVIEIQGDHRKAVAEELERHGFTVKLAGG